MVNVYACLLGEWINLNEVDAKIMVKSDNLTDPTTWYNKGGFFSNGTNPRISTYEGYEKIDILYNNKIYSIHPSFIQIVKY